MGFLTDIPTGFPGYTGRIPARRPRCPRILRDAGYSTFAVGKWHLAPRWEQSASGPFDPLAARARLRALLRLPRRRHQPVDARPRPRQRLRRAAGPARGRLPPHRGPRRPGHPADPRPAARPRRTSRSSSTSPPARCTRRTTRPASGSTATAAASTTGGRRGATRTFERQVATGVVPDGHRAARAAAVGAGAGTSLSADEQRLFARMMEVFAGFLSHTDAQIGRLLDFLARDRRARRHARAAHLRQRHQRRGRTARHRSTSTASPTTSWTTSTSTLGRIDELGGFRSYNHYPWGWAWAGNTPLRLWKRYTWLGGVRTPLIVHWPDGITDGGRDPRRSSATRSTCCRRSRRHRASTRPSGSTASSSLARRREPAPHVHRRRPRRRRGARSTSRCSGRGRSTTTGGRRRPTTSARSSPSRRSALEGSHEFGDDHWALFDLTDDFSESNDVAAEHPDRVARMEELWWAEAGRNQVLPLEDTLPRPGGGDGAGPERAPAPHHLPARRRRRRRGPAPADRRRLPAHGRRWTCPTATPCDGVLCALGDWVQRLGVVPARGAAGRRVQPVRAHRPVAAASRSGRATTSSGSPTPTAALTLARRRRDGRRRRRCPAHLPFRWQIGGGRLLIGRDAGFPVCDDYEPPFPFTGRAAHGHLRDPDVRPPRPRRADRHRPPQRVTRPFRDLGHCPGPGTGSRKPVRARRPRPRGARPRGAAARGGGS